MKKTKKKIISSYKDGTGRINVQSNNGWKKIIENGLLSIFIVYSIITAPFIIKDLGLLFHNLPTYLNNEEVYGNYVFGEIRIYGNKIQDWRGIIKTTIHEAGHYYYWREITYSHALKGGVFIPNFTFNCV